MKTKFRLFKRDENASAHYYFRFTFRGKSHSLCLETNDAVEAQRRAKVKHEAVTTAVVTGNYTKLSATRTRHEVLATIPALLEAYKTSPCDANPATRHTNSRALLRVVPRATSVSDLTADAARKFFAAVNKTALAEPNQILAASMRRTANTTWRKASSLFTPKCLQHYRTIQIHNPTMDEFASAGNVATFSGRSVPKIEYNPPSDAVIAKTLAAWPLLVDLDPDLYLAVGHELAFGLRISEVAQATWSWHQVRSGYPVLDGHAKVKAGTGLIQVRALDPYFTQMQIQIDLQGWRREPEDYIITGTDFYRRVLLFRASSLWLRRLGWDTRMTNHALRALAGGQVAMKYGIYEAQGFLRHTSVKVTEQNYAHFISKFKPENPDELPYRWATVAKATPPAPVTRPQPTLLEMMECHARN